MLLVMEVTVALMKLLRIKTKSSTRGVAKGSGSEKID